ncbi:MAG: biotin/lipoyl-binding protein [Myxococcales bacterium]|nr:biotin/lipoyl-binding protein [Myxococcales bacterium]
MRITVDGKSYDVLVETLDGAQAAASATLASQQQQPMVQTMAAQPTIAAPVPQPVATPAAATGGAPVTSPLSGTVIEIHAKEGQAVKEGDLLVTLEAMKMNTPINAPHAGTVRSIAVHKGDVIEESATLLTLG